MINTDIEFLKTQPENAGQRVNLILNNGQKQTFYFLWFITENKIDLRPETGIIIKTVSRENWDKIKILFG